MAVPLTPKLGLITTLVSFIIHSSNYLIIPYPRWVVLVVEIAPALLTKTLIPHFLHHVPYWMRPVIIGAAWLVAAAIAKVTPPNVAPPLRIITSVIVSVTSTAIEVSLLGMTRYYGKLGLAGWGAGVGAGAAICAVLPFVVTVWMGWFLRDFIDWILPLTGAMLVVFFGILPSAPLNYPEARSDRLKADIEDGQDASLVAQDHLGELSRMLSDKNRMQMSESMIRPYMAPLFFAFAVQALVFPGIARALPISSSFLTFVSYFTNYGFAFHFGSFIGRSLTPLVRPQNTKIAFTGLIVITGVVLLNAVLALFSSHVVLGCLAFCAGAAGGVVYMIVMERVHEDKSFGAEINLEFSMQAVGVGETAGVMFGGLMGVFLETVLCVLPTDANRWCQVAR